MLISLAFMITTALSTPQASSEPIASNTAAETQPLPFSQRPNARVMMSRSIRNFDVRREDGSDRIIYLEAARNNWLRGELLCRGIGDPRDAHSLEIGDHTTGLSVNSTLIFRALSHETSVCTLASLVAITPEEAMERKLIRAPKPKKD